MRTLNLNKISLMAVCIFNICNTLAQDHYSINTAGGDTINLEGDIVSYSIGENLNIIQQTEPEEIKLSNPTFEIEPPPPKEIEKPKKKTNFIQAIIDFFTHIFKRKQSLKP